MKDINDLVASLKANVKVDDSYQNISGGLEGLDPSMQAVVMGKRDTFVAAVESALKSVALGADGESGFDIQPHQLEAAKQVAIAAIDPMATLERLSKGRAPVDSGLEAIMVDTSHMVDDFIPNDQMMAGIEAFDGQVLASSMYFSVVYQSSIKQDAVAELFYPLVVIDANQVGATVSAKITNIMTAIKRDVTGKPVNFKKESIIKKLDDTSLFTLDANRLYPVLRVENEDKLLNPVGVNGLVRTVEVLDGVEITTAPLLTGKKVDLLGIAQTDELLASGVMDETDSLNGHLAVEKLYFTLTGDDSGGASVTEYHAKNIKGLPAVFTYTPTGNSKELQLDYKTDSLAWIGGGITKADGTPTAIADLATLPAGYTIKLSINLKGDAHAQEGTTAVYPVVVEMGDIIDASGNALVDTDPIYIAVKAVFDTVALVGYDVEAYASNSNARFRGKLLTTDTYTYAYTVPVRTKIREITSTIKTGEDGDAAGIVAQIDFTKRALSKSGLVELNNTAAVLETLSDDTMAFGISNLLVNKYFDKASLDMTTVVDSIKSLEREGDITAALRLTIRNMAIDMYTKSNYTFAFEAIYPNAKPTVIIGTDTNIGRFLSNFEDEVFKYEVRISNDELVSGRIFTSFGIMGAGRNKEANMLNFGTCFWSPEVVISLQRQENGTVKQETITMPRFKHQTLMPIMGLLEVTGIEAVSGKLPINFHTV